MPRDYEVIWQLFAGLAVIVREAPVVAAVLGVWILVKTWKPGNW